MKNILVPIEDHRFIPSVLQSAKLVATKFASRIEAVALGPDFEALVAANFTFSVSITDEKAQHVLQNQLHQIFDDFRRTQAESPDAKIEFAWNDGGLFTDTKVGAYGRVFDLTIVGRPGSDSHDPRQLTLEAALFDSGRPIVVAPPQPPKSIGEVIAVAWNASTETARTVGFAMPFLKKAKQVVVIAVTGAMSPGPSPDLLAQALRRHGLQVGLEVITDNSQGAGRLILRRAAALGADLLVKGGYTQSRLRQMVFGGTTSQILAEAELPVFMAH
jgi:nucleotide-binding universal stress UspA family protein